MWGIRKLAKNEIRLSSKSWHIRNPSSMNKLGERASKRND
jgi:hypothetical protein